LYKSLFIVTEDGLLLYYLIYLLLYLYLILKIRPSIFLVCLPLTTDNEDLLLSALIYIHPCPYELELLTSTIRSPIPKRIELCVVYI
jgi:hypothetical protein